MKRASIFSRDFLLLSLSNFSAFLSFYFLLATLPIYVVRVGGRESEVGFIIGIFAATALVLRPVVGSLADRWGRRRLILSGAAVLLLSSLLYTLTTSPATLLVLRVLHGAGWAAFGTASFALVGDLLPPERRGEGVGYYGMSVNLAMAVGPAAGVLLMRAFDFSWLFLSAAGVALLSLLLAAPLGERVNPAPGRGNPLVERQALFPSAILALLALTYGSIVSFLPLFAVQRGWQNPGLFFTIYALVVLVSRGPLGRLTDRYGRGVAVGPGLALAGLGLGVLSLASSPLHFLLAALFYGLAFAAAQPALMALTLDRVNPSRRGVAMGTFSAAMDLGIGAGSFLWGVVAQVAGYPAIYQGGALVALIALGIFLAARRD